MALAPTDVSNIMISC